MSMYTCMYIHDNVHTDTYTVHVYTCMIHMPVHVHVYMYMYMYMVCKGDLCLGHELVRIITCVVCACHYNPLSGSVL